MERDKLFPQEAVEHFVGAIAEAIDYVSSRPGIPILVGGESWEHRTQVLKAVAVAKALYYLPLGYNLSKALLPVPPKRRPLRVADSVRTLAMPPQGSGMDGCAMDHIEVLFLPALEVNVLSLLRKIARERLLVVSWPGTWKKGHLTYAEPGHPEFQRGTDDEIIYISLEA